MKSSLNPRWLLEQLVREGCDVPSVKLMVGTKDRLLGCTRSFSKALIDSGAQVDYFEGSGEHSFDFVQAHLQEGLDWLLS